MFAAEKRFLTFLLVISPIVLLVKTALLLPPAMMLSGDLYSAIMLSD